LRDQTQVMLVKAFIHLRVQVIYLRKHKFCKLHIMTLTILTHQETRLKRTIADKNNIPLRYIRCWKTAVLNSFFITKPLIILSNRAKTVSIFIISQVSIMEVRNQKQKHPSIIITLDPILLMLWIIIWFKVVLSIIEII